MFASPKPGPHPWTDLRASIDTRLPEVVASDHPCAPCSAPCCWYLLLEKDTIEGKDDIDAIEEYMRYDSMLAWIGEDSEYAIGYVTPCSNLDPQNYSCSLFEKPIRPTVCTDYSPVPCWYRWHMSSSAKEVSRVDVRRWAGFRKEIEKALGPLPNPDDLYPEAVVCDVPVRLAFDIPDDTVATQGRDDLLYFFSCFEKASVARTSDDWYLLVEAKRRADRPPASFECKSKHIGESPESESLVLNRDAVRQLASLPDIELFECCVEDLRRLVERLPV